MSQITGQLNPVTMFFDSLTPEQKILVLCSRTSMSSEQRRLAEELVSSGRLDWEEVLRLSRRHLVTSLLFHSLSAAGLQESVPAVIREQMRNFTASNLGRNMQKRVELLNILDAMEKRGVRIVVLKGNALVHTVYHDESLRVFTDIDLLIPKSRLADVKKVMANIGYHRASGIYRFPDELNEELGHEWVYQNHKGTLIELHWRLMDKQTPFNVDSTQLIKRSVPFLLDDHQVFALNTEDELIHLSIHQFKHHWQRLRDLCDINEIVSQAEVNWQVLLQRSAEADADKCLFYTLRLAKEVLDAPIPPEIIDELGNRVKPGIFSKSMFDMIRKNILAYESPHFYWPVILLDGFSAKAKVVIAATSKPAAERFKEKQGKQTPIIGLLKSLPATLVSLKTYRKLIIDLSQFIARNIAAKAAKFRRRQ